MSFCILYDDSFTRNIPREISLCRLMSLSVYIVPVRFPGGSGIVCTSVVHLGQVLVSLLKCQAIGLELTCEKC